MLVKLFNCPIIDTFGSTIILSDKSMVVKLFNLTIASGIRPLI